MDQLINQRGIPSASGVVDPHPVHFTSFWSKGSSPPTFQDHWGVGLPQLRLPGVVSPPVMGLQACSNPLFGEHPYRRLDPKIPVMGENRDRYLFVRLDTAVTLEPVSDCDNPW